MIIKKVMIK